MSTMREGVLLWEAASEDEVLATVALVRASVDGTVLVADNVPMDYRGGVALLVGDRAGARSTRLLARDEHRQPRCAQFTADGRRVMIGTAGSSARWSLWNVGDEQPLACVQAPYALLLQERMDARNEAVAREELEHVDEVFGDRGVVAGAVSADGTLVAGSSEPVGDSAILDARWLSRLVYLWKIGAARPNAMFEAAEPVDALAFTNDGRSLGVATRSGAVEIWDVATARRIVRHAPPLRSSRPVVLRARPDSRGFVLGTIDGTLIDAPLDGDSTVAPAMLDGPLGDLVVRDDGSLVVVSWTNARIVVVDHATGVRRDLAAPSDLADFGTAALAPDAAALLVATPSDVRRIAW